jgi:molybdopterin/thiamine biosynthesis adenylyltransferase
MNKYIRQETLKEIGEDGQRKIKKAKIAIIGIGALGTVTAELLARAGIGELLLIDKDKITIENIHRQIFTHAQIHTSDQRPSAKPPPCCNQKHNHTHTHTHTINIHRQIFRHTQIHNFDQRPSAKPPPCCSQKHNYAHIHTHTNTYTDKH